jgi:hypothetical protein
VVQSITEIAQLALVHCGVSKTIQNVLTERSIEAQACRAVGHTARQTTLRAVPWLFAKKFASPALVAGPNPMATVEWAYAYQAPPDMLHMIRFVSTRLNNDTRQSRIPYTIVDSASGLLIYSNWPGNFNNVPVTIEYTYDNQDLPRWPSDFVLAMSYYIGYLIAPVITAGDPYQLQQKLMGLYTQAVTKASDANANEEQRPQEPQSEFVRARDGYGFGEGRGEQWEATGGGFSVD